MVRLIVVTDGDAHARMAVEQAAGGIGLRTISRSAGSPTPLDASAIVDLAELTPRGPVVVMVDDHGHPGEGIGGACLKDLMCHPRCAVIGVVAAAARTGPESIVVRQSIDRRGVLVKGAVDKYGHTTGGYRLYGDTVAPVADSGIPVIGIGDPGKHGSAQALRRALQWILNASGECERMH